MASEKPEESQFKSLIPSQDEINKTMNEILQNYPAAAPVFLMQIQFAYMMKKYLENMSKQLEESIKEMIDNANKNM